MSVIPIAIDSTGRLQRRAHVALDVGRTTRPVVSPGPIPNPIPNLVAEENADTMAYFVKSATPGSIAVGLDGVDPLAVSGTQRLMYYGTSTTDGLGDNAFREPAQTALTAAFPGVAFTHVGDRGSSPWNHEGLPGGGMSGLGAAIAADIATHTPDIISIMVGENDVDVAGSAYDPVLTPALFRTMLENIRAADTDVQIVVTPPTIPNPSETGTDIDTYRANLADLVPKMVQIAREFSAIVEDTYTWSVSNLVAADFDDDVHHSTAGKAKLGSRVALGVGEAVGRNLAPASYVTAPEVVTPPSLSGNITEGDTVTVVPGIVDAFPQVTSTYRILVDGVSVGAGPYEFVAGDVGDSVVVEQTAGADVETSADLGPVAAGGGAIIPVAADLVYAHEMWQGVTHAVENNADTGNVDSDLISAIAGQHGTTATASAAMADRPTYLPTGGRNGGPAARFGAIDPGDGAANPVNPMMAISEDALPVAGDFTMAVMINPHSVVSDFAWFLGFASLRGFFSSRSSSIDKPGFFDGAGTYAVQAGGTPGEDSSADAQLGWQLLIFQLTGTTLRMYRGRTEMGSGVTVSPAALTGGQLGAVDTGTRFPVDADIEGIYFWDSSTPVPSEVSDYVQAVRPGYAPA